MLFFLPDNDEPAIRVSPEVAANMRGDGHLIEVIDEGSGAFSLRHVRAIGAPFTKVDEARAALDSTLHHRMLSRHQKIKANRARREREEREAEPAPGVVRSYEWRPGAHWREAWHGPQ